MHVLFFAGPRRDSPDDLTSDEDIEASEILEATLTSLSGASFGMHQPQQKRKPRAKSEESSKVSLAFGKVSLVNLIALQSNKKKDAAEHVDGVFRNLQMTSSSANSVRMMSASSRSRSSSSFQKVNRTVASRQKPIVLSMDSLTSTSSSSSSSSMSEDSVSGRKGPRPAYSEANMHNSLGYLP